MGVLGTATRAAFQVADWMTGKATRRETLMDHTVGGSDTGM
jgi:hypothetical protein